MLVDDEVEQPTKRLELDNELDPLDEYESITVPAWDVTNAWEQMFDDGDMRRISSIRLSESDVSRLRGFLFVLHPGLLVSPGPFGVIPSDIDAFYRDIVAPILGRHPVLAKAEVRDCGNELHLILWIDEELFLWREDKIEEDILIWDLEECHAAISAVLPCDQRRFRLNATTRAVGTKNSSTRTFVRKLKDGGYIAINDLFHFVRAWLDAPMSLGGCILLGDSPVKPCPFCRAADSSLIIGSIYAECCSCGRHIYRDLVKAIYGFENGSKVFLSATLADCRDDEADVAKLRLRFAQYQKEQPQISS
jgi:hypothetical protein